MVHNGLQYGTLENSELLTYQPTGNLPASESIGEPLKSQCFMTTYGALSFI